MLTAELTASLAGTPMTLDGTACQRCGTNHFSPNLEAFELTGELLCDNCAEEVFEENSQFGMGA